MAPALHDRLDELALGLGRSCDGLDPEVRWPIELALDVTLCYPKGPNPLPAGTWRSLAQSLGLRLIDQAGSGIPGARPAGVALKLLEAAAALSHRETIKADLELELAEMVLGDLGPDDLLSSRWERHGATTLGNGDGEVLGLPGPPSEALIRPREAARA